MSKHAWRVRLYVVISVAAFAGCMTASTYVNLLVLAFIGSALVSSFVAFGVYIGCRELFEDEETRP